ncbi:MULTISPECIES: hypothetical protein [unclassified Rathayibacter]|uniref:hypothetical protein n=1 Tax=unclassified Rathayibacter TaxID=2609250 RepID=UPI0015E3F669|nr:MULTISPECIES: hypothetical protein [unclassified Rathayibacter]
MPDRSDVVAVLDALIALLEEYERPQWAVVLRHDRSRLRSGDDGAYDVLRYRLSAPRGLRETTTGLADRRLNERFRVLVDRLEGLLVPDRAADSDSTPLPPPDFGERTERTAPAPVLHSAAAYERGTLLLLGGGRFYRSTWTVLSRDDRDRLRPVLRVWVPCEVVSVEEYRSLQHACLGWWLTLAGIVPAFAAVAVFVAPPPTFGLLYSVCFVLLVAAAVMVGVVERRRSAVAALWSERTGRLVAPISRGVPSREAERRPPR